MEPELGEQVSDMLLTCLHQHVALVLRSCAWLEPPPLGAAVFSRCCSSCRVDRGILRMLSRQASHAQDQTGTRRDIHTAIRTHDWVYMHPLAGQWTLQK